MKNVIIPISTILMVLVIVKYKLSPQKIAMVGMIVLGIAMLNNVLRLDLIAGYCADLAWIAFLISGVIEFSKSIVSSKRTRTAENANT